MPRPLDDGGPGRASAGVRVAAALIFALIGVAACSNGSSTSSTSSAPASTAAPASSSGVPNSAALCTASADFQAAADNLVHLNLGTLSVDSVKAALQNLVTTGTSLATAAKDQYRPQVDALEAALESLKTTIASLSDQSSLTAKLGAISTSVSGVTQAAGAIVNMARAGCPSVSPGASPPPSS